MSTVQNHRKVHEISTASSRTMRTRSLHDGLPGSLPTTRTTPPPLAAHSHQQWLPIALLAARRLSGPKEPQARPSRRGHQPSMRASRRSTGLAAVHVNVLQLASQCRSP
mmetsp:Transcript_118374/g.339780  ORF Transcript_118374/g.339780 Transcript_118374/m.339780 type:complete len:109 (+) Transcript_118374:222-548(+)